MYMFAHHLYILHVHVQYNGSTSVACTHLTMDKGFVLSMHKYPIKIVFLLKHCQQKQCHSSGTRQAMFQASLVKSLWDAHHV